MKKGFTKTTVVLAVLLVIFAVVSVYALVQMHNWKSMYQELADAVEELGIEIELPDQKEEGKNPANCEHSYRGGKCTRCGAEQPDTEGMKFALSKDGKAYYCDGYGYDDAPASVKIPAYHNGKPVIGITKDAFWYQSYMKEVIIPETVKTIEDGAFSSCFVLTSITIPDSVIRISPGAFQNTGNLETVHISTTGWCWRGEVKDFSDPYETANFFRAVTEEYYGSQAYVLREESDE